MTFEARIKRIFPETDKIKATASITIDGSYAVHGIKILETASGLAVVMPNRKFGDRYYDTFHPVNAYEYVDSDFEEEAPPPESIKVVLVKPMQKPVIAEIGTELKDLQGMVGGLIEAV
jgi:stage V sporulation protein G